MRNTTSIQKVLAFTLISLCLTALIYCIATKTKNTEANLHDNMVLSNDWLKKPTCYPPCWNRIIPGKTSLFQSLGILLSAGNVAEVNIEKFGDFGTVEWESEELQNSEGGRFFYDSANSIVYAVEPSFKCCSSLKDVIRIYGEPSHVIILASQIFEEPNVGDWIYSYRIIWINIGLEVHGNPNIDGEIDKDFNVSAIAYFEPGKDGLLKYEGRIVELIVDWKGYNNRSVYLLEQ